MEEEVYCTMLLTDGYLPGAQVLAHSLRDGGATRKLAVLATQEFLSDSTMDELRRIYDYVIPVDRITNRAHGNLALMGRLDLSSAFTKIHLWRQTQFAKIVYIDADAVALRAPEELFEVTERFAACPDIGWPDCFNSGVMVLKPDMGTFYGLRNLAQRGISFDGADQGLLNQHFREWRRLSFVYNVTPSGHYQYVPAYNHYRSSITVAHFIGANKPWKVGREAGQESNSPYGELLGRWWAIWDIHYRPLTEQDPSLAWGVPQAAATRYERPNPMPTEYDPHFRRQHGSFDDRPHEQAAVWHPPGSHQHQAEQDRHHKEHHHDQHHHHPPPPVFLPREHVPYVPRDVPYSAYSQTQNHQHHEHRQEHAPPPQQQHSHDGRRFSQEISHRLENSLPLPPHQSKPSGSFDPPMQTWDASHSPPPSNSKPEASNWPVRVYENTWDQANQDTTLFVPPPSQPPPVNLNFEVPPKPASVPRPAPIFPWEHRAVPRATRVFAGEPEFEPEPEPAVEEEEGEGVEADVEDEYETEETALPSAIAGFESYSRGNVWDNIPAIEEYVASFTKGREGGVRRRGGDVTPNPQLRNWGGDSAGEQNPVIVLRGGMLPPEMSVTPTPFKAMRRGYRSSAMDDESKFPSAVGIPDQQHWDPFRQLEELKNAPGELLSKRSPPSPSRGSPPSVVSSSGSRVSSSMPVPEKEFHITAYQRRHEEAVASLSSSSFSTVSAGELDGQQQYGVEGVPWRPQPRRYTAASTQTESLDVSDAEAQSDGEEIDAEMAALKIRKP